MRDVERREDAGLKFAVIVMIFLLGAPGWAGTADAAVETKFGGEFRARGFYVDNPYDLNSSLKDEEAFSDARFRLKISAAEGLAAGVVLIDFFNGESGRDVATINSASGDGTGDRILGRDGFGRSLDTVRLKEGYLRVSWPLFHLVIGRQSVTLGHGLVLDDTADATTVAIPLGWATLTLMDLLIDTPARGAGNSSVYLANLNLSPTSDFRSSLFALVLKDRGPNLSFGSTPFFNPCGAAAICPVSDFGHDRASLAVMGWSMDHQGPTIQWAAEVNYLTGSIRSQEAAVRNPDARAIDLHGINGLGRLGGRVRQFDIQLTGLYASGQKAKDLPPTGHKLNLNAISPNFALGNILANNETVSDRDGGNIGGLTAAKLAIGWRPGGQFRGELAGIRVRMTERPTPDASRDLGWELDANAAWQIDPPLLWRGGFGILFPGEAWLTLRGDPAADDHVIKVSTSLTYSF